jgi:lysophospholipase L1-like esterase
MIRKTIPILVLFLLCATIASAAKPDPLCDEDGDSFLSDHKKCGGDDCDDHNKQISPEALEICDGVDNNCDGNIDEGCSEPPPSPTKCDLDADGYKADSRRCKGNDCDDSDPEVYPDATEICDGIDNNCDDQVDEGCSSYPGSMAAAGDSITLAYNADGNSTLFGGQTYEQYEVSWALGNSTRVYSHAQRFSELNPAFIWDAQNDNYAVSGANMIDLQDQVTQIVQNGPYDYVTIFIGHNDICDASEPAGMLDTAIFESLFTAAMDILYSQENPPDVVVSSLAKISDLYNVGRNDGWCDFIWRIGNICRVVTSGNPDYIVQADQRAQEYNDVLAFHAAEYGYTYVPQIYETQFSLEDLSNFDCFHPSVSGQNRIADIIWENGLY